MGKYDDIINLPHHQSDHRPHMSLHDRAAQFSPFAALVGYEAAIEEAGRLTEGFREIDEGEKAALDETLSFLEAHKESRQEIKVLHFIPDERKAGGSYVETTGEFWKVDRSAKEMVLSDGVRIPLGGIAEIRLS